jgi:hypothetical protein
MSENRIRISGSCGSWIQPSISARSASSGPQAEGIPLAERIISGDFSVAYKTICVTDS